MFENTKESPEPVNWRLSDKKKDKNTNIDRQNNTQEHTKDWAKWIVMNSDAAEVWAIHVPLVAIPLLLLLTIWRNSIRQQGARVAQWVRLLDRTAHTSLSPIWRGFAPSFVSYQKGCTRLVAASDKVSQLLAHGRWFSPGTPASSTTKTGTHSHSGQNKYLSYSTCEPNTISIMLRIPLFFLSYFIWYMIHVSGWFILYYIYLYNQDLYPTRSEGIPLC
jgi:hypothetical protein